MKKRKVLCILTVDASAPSLQRGIDEKLEELGDGWQIISASSSVSICREAETNSCPTICVTTIIVEEV